VISDRLERRSRPLDVRRYPDGYRIELVAGSTQRDPRRAALLGLGCTAAALAG
jgi:hypothetical protein